MLHRPGVTGGMRCCNRICVLSCNSSMKAGEALTSCRAASYRGPYSDRHTFCWSLQLLSKMKRFGYQGTSATRQPWTLIMRKKKCLDTSAEATLKVAEVKVSVGRQAILPRPLPLAPSGVPTHAALCTFTPVSLTLLEGRDFVRPSYFLCAKRTGDDTANIAPSGYQSKKEPSLRFHFRYLLGCRSVSSSLSPLKFLQVTLGPGTSNIGSRGSPRQ